MPSSCRIGSRPGISFPHTCHRDPSLPQAALLDHSMPHRYPYARLSVIPLLPDGFSYRAGKRFAGSHAAAIPFPAAKNICDTFFAFCRSVFPCLFPGAAILLPPGIPCRFHDTDIFPSAFSVSLSPHLLLCYIYGTYMTRHIVPFFIFVSVSSHPFLSSFTVTNLTRIIFLWIISCLFRDTLALSY